MKAIAGAALAIAAGALSACNLAFGTLGAWSNEMPPPDSSEGASAVVLPGGEVVFLGGYDLSTGQPLDQVVRFDPTSRSWSRGAPMPLKQGGFALAALSNGSLLVAGGQAPDGGVRVLATTWLYNPGLNSWTRGGDLRVGRTGAQAVLLTDGRVLIAGGDVPLATPVPRTDGGTDYYGITSSAEVFDPQTNAWSLVGPMHVGRGAFALVALEHGAALAAGGCSSTNPGFFQGGPVSNAELFDPVAGSWTVTTPLLEPRCGASALRLGDGRVLLTGDAFASGAAEANAALYDPRNQTWTPAGSTLQNSSAPTLLSDGRVFVAAVEAGSTQGRVQSVVVGGEVFDPALNDWRFATSNAAQVVVQGGQNQLPPPYLIAQPDGTAMVLLATARVAFTFNPSSQTPPALIFDSPGLTLVLAGLAAALCLWLAILYMRNRSLRAGKQRPPASIGSR